MFGSPGLGMGRMDIKNPASEMLAFPSSNIVPERVAEFAVMVMASPVRTNGRKYSGLGDVPGLVTLSSLGELVLLSTIIPVPLLSTGVLVFESTIVVPLLSGSPGSVELFSLLVSDVLFPSVDGLLPLSDTKSDQSYGQFGLEENDWWIKPLLVSERKSIS